MQIRTPITKDKIKHHFQYHWWVYVLWIVLNLFFWNLLFSTTQYRTPGHLKIEFFAEGYQAADTDDALELLMSKIHEDVLPDIEEVSYRLLTLDSTYGPVQLTVWSSAGEGDLFLLTRDYFRQMAEGGAMLDLQPYIDDGTLAVDGIDLRAGLVRNAHTSERHQYGIPTASLAGLADVGLITEGSFLSILASTENPTETVQMLQYLLEHMR